MKKSQKFLIESGVLLTTMVIKAKKTGTSVKKYFYEEETIKHISLVLYDLLPLSVKIGMRYQKFHEIFERNFKAIRNAVLGQEEMIELNNNIKKNTTKKINTEKKLIQESIVQAKKEPRKTRIKKVINEKEQKVAVTNKN